MDTECQTSASERFFTEFARAADHGCISSSNAGAIDMAIRGAANSVRSAIKQPLSACAAVEVTAIHDDKLTGNSRLAKIENGQVPCMNADDATIASCAFVTAPGRQSGEWLESPQGNVLFLAAN